MAEQTKRRAALRPALKRGGTIFTRAPKSTANSVERLRKCAAPPAFHLYGHLVIGMRDYNIVAGAIITACGGEGFSLVSPRP
jgi:hypothetical protein